MAVGFIRARSRAAYIAAGVLALAVVAPSAASASPFNPSGVLHLPGSPHLQLNANQSTNWFGYNQGVLEQGGKLFNSISADWTVPTATQHTSGQAENSATWIGIGGGCIDSGCTVTDPTSLIQTGTEQDVDAAGKASYSAWWELVPVPALTISNMTVSAGDRMHANVAEVANDSNLWTITLQDLTKGETFSQTIVYPSSHATAEWIEETPVTIGTSGAGLAALPNLTETPFDNATVNGAPANLKASEQLNLTNGSQVIGTPSAPDLESDGFGACAWATSCSVPAS
jgi:Peptidase A4 family